jgi:twitching motility protein PilT
LPECEILTVTQPVKAHIRRRDFFKITPVMETGGDHGMWTFQRYRSWMERKRDWHVPSAQDETPDSEPVEENTDGIAASPASPSQQPGRPASDTSTSPPQPSRQKEPRSPGRIEIEPVEGEFGKILRPPSR